MFIYEDLKIRRGDVVVSSTDTTIPFTWSFIKAFSRQFVLFVYVSCIFGLRQVLPGKRYKIGFYPRRPRPWYQVWNVTRFMGVQYSEEISDCDVLFYFEDKTRSTLKTDYLGVPNVKAINGYCTDIGKDKVARVFEEVFGYSLEIDPTTFQGRAVRKSIENAAHDGQIIDCPIPQRDAGVVYQRLIENSYDGKTVQDLRCPVIGNAIPVVYIKKRPIDIRFENENTAGDLMRTEDVFSEAEVRRLLVFSRRMGLDFGGLDVLRDRDSGRIFVVDVNKTCMGPPVPLTYLEKHRALTRLGKALIDLIEDHKS